MKKLFSVVLLFAIILSFSSCQEEPKPKLDSDNSNTSSSVNEDDKIKKAALDLIADSRKDPTELFAHFAGDFQINNFTSSKDAVQSIRRKKAVTLVNAGSLNYYGIEAAGCLFYAADYNKKSEVVACLPLSEDDSDFSTIFTVFGIDTSSLYTVADEDDEDEYDELQPTADMLVVNEDKSGCDFTKSYIDKLAKMLYKTMAIKELTGATKASFLDNYAGGGFYSVAENKVTFDIQVVDDQIGTIHMIIKHAIDKDGKGYHYLYLEYSNADLGITTPIIAETEFKDVVYLEDTPVSATIKMKTSTPSNILYGDVVIEQVENIEATFDLDCTDLDFRSATATYNKEQIQTAMGNSTTSNFNYSMSIDLGKVISQFKFTQKQDGETLNYLEANSLTFATSSLISTPDRVVDAITDYIEQQLLLSDI